jgi:hypothetical protein
MGRIGSGLLHHEALVTWLNFSLRQQKADVSIYLDGTPRPAGEVRRLQALGKAALPQTAVEPERQLFLSERKRQSNGIYARASFGVEVESWWHRKGRIAGTGAERKRIS